MEDESDRQRILAYTVAEIRKARKVVATPSQTVAEYVERPGSIPIAARLRFGEAGGGGTPMAVEREPGNISKP